MRGGGNEGEEIVSEMGMGIGGEVGCDDRMGGQEGGVYFSDGFLWQWWWPSCRWQWS